MRYAALMRVGVCVCGVYVMFGTAARSTASWLSKEAGDFVYWVPVAAHAAGVGDSQWRTDLGILNLCEDAATVQLRLHTSQGSFETQLGIEPGAHDLIEDVVMLLAGKDTGGALEISADRALTVSSRTYSQSAEGTLGQALDGVSLGDGLPVVESGYLQQLREDSRFRTNIGVLNMGIEKATVLIALFESDGSQVGDFFIAVPPGSTVQENRPYERRFGRNDISGGYARITPMAGAGIYPYASVVDNQSDDPTTVTMKRMPVCEIGHRIWDISTTPAYPATLTWGDEVDVRFSYHTSEPGGVRIFTRPMTGDVSTPDYAASGSPLYPSGDGIAGGSFTIDSGEVTVDRIRIRMLNADQSRILLETFISVEYTFSGR